MVHELTRSFELGCHVGQAKSNGLMFYDCLAEASALLRVEECNLKSSASHADGLRSDADAPALQVGKGNAVALAFGAEPVFLPHAQCVEILRTRQRTRLVQLAFNPAIA